MPPRSNINTTHALITIAPIAGFPLPNRAQRKPSITPAKGLRLNIRRHFSGTILTEYTTGDAYIQSWTKNGIVYLMSRYRALRGDSHSPTASAVIKARTTNTGKTNTPHPGVIPNQASITRRTKNETKKSTRGDATAAKGIIRRGKYTFFIRFESPTRLSPLRVMAWEK